MQKRGMLALKPIIEIIVGTFIALSLFGIAKGFGTQDFFIQQRLAMESALFIDEFYNLEGNIFVKYPSDLKYPVSLRKDTFTVKHPIAEIIVPFAPADEINPKTLYEGSLFLYKNGDIVSIDSKTDELKKLDCAVKKIEVGTATIKVTEKTKIIAETLGFRCFADICFKNSASQPTDPDLNIILEPQQEGVTVSSIGKQANDVGCIIFNGILEHSPDALLWSLPLKVEDNYRQTIKISLADEHIEDVIRGLEVVIT